MDFKDYITKQKLLYKYAPINVFTYRNLINNELLFSNPKNFNDPNDCRFKLRLNGLTDEGVQDFYKDKNLSPEQLQSKLSLFEADKDIIVKEIEDEYNEKLSQEYVVGCFSEKNDNMLMWAHYADNSKGICLIFDWKIHEAYFQGCKVQYSSEFPMLDYDGNGQLDATRIFLTKHESWKYEEEVRGIAKIDGGRNPITFNPKALKGVIFGYRTDAEDKAAIKSLVGMHKEYSGVKFYDALPNHLHSKMEIKEI